MVQFHSVYVQRRQPGTSYRNFQRLWRSHGDYAATIPAFWNEVERYIQNDPVEEPGDLPGNTAEFDGVGELFYTNYENWLAIRDVMWHQVAPDEKRVFAGPPTIAVRGKRTIYQEPYGSCKLFTFARYRVGLEPGEWEAAAARHAAETLEVDGFGDLLSGFTITSARRHDPESEMDKMAQTTSSHDVLFICHFTNDDIARRALRSPAYARIKCAQEGPLDMPSRVVMLTHGWVLKGEAG